MALWPRCRHQGRTPASSWVLRRGRSSVVHYLVAIFDRHSLLQKLPLRNYRQHRPRLVALLRRRLIIWSKNLVLVALRPVETLCRNALLNTITHVKSHQLKLCRREYKYPNCPNPKDKPSSLGGNLMRCRNASRVVAARHIL